MDLGIFGGSGTKPPQILRSNCIICPVLQVRKLRQEVKLLVMIPELLCGGIGLCFRQSGLGTDSIVRWV